MGKRRTSPEDKVIGCAFSLMVPLILAWMGFVAWVIYVLVEHFAH